MGAPYVDWEAVRLAYISTAKSYRQVAKEMGVSYKGDIAEYNCSIAAQEIRKIAKDHGDPLIEAKRGQRAVIADDYLKVPDVVEQADKITLSPDTYEGKPALIFKKRIDGSDVSVVGVISNKHMDLFVQTMYASANKKSLATPTDEQASANTPEATRGTALGGIVAQDADDVNPGALYQQRDPDQISDRELLATALQSVTQNADEWDNLRRYQKKIAALNEKQRMLEQTDARIAELKGKSDRASRDELIRMQNNARTLARSIERADGELLKYEAMKPIKKLAERQREDYRQKLKERTDERMRKYKERLKQDMQDRIREVREREAEKGQRRLDKAVEHAREVGQRRMDRLKESEAKAKYMKLKSTARSTFRKK